MPGRDTPERDATERDLAEAHRNGGHPPSPLQELADERLAAAGVRLFLKRDDLLHPSVPGNKWRKLLPNLAAARAGGHDTLLTFGGAYSNHLRATAAAGQQVGLRTIGVVRGDELRGRPLNASLTQAATWGMEFDFVDRATWRRRMSAEVLAELHRRHGPALVVPEGGSNAAGVRGCLSLGRELAQTPAGVVAVSVGTGGTLAGLAAGLAPHQRAIGYAALSHAPLAAETAALQTEAFGRPTRNWRIEDGHCFGGYGRTTPGLLAFADAFEAAHGVRLDRSYEAKALFGIFACLGTGEFRRGAAVAVVLAG